MFGIIRRALLLVNLDVLTCFFCRTKVIQIVLGLVKALGLLARGQSLGDLPSYDKLSKLQVALSELNRMLTGVAVRLGCEWSSRSEVLRSTVSSDQATSRCINEKYLATSRPRTKHRHESRNL